MLCCSGSVFFNGDGGETDVQNPWSYFQWWQSLPVLANPSDVYVLVMGCDECQQDSTEALAGVLCSLVPAWSTDNADLQSLLDPPLAISALARATCFQKQVVRPGSNAAAVSAVTTDNLVACRGFAR